MAPSIRPVLGDRDQDGDGGLAVEQRHLLESTVLLPREPARVRPVEVVEVTELVHVGLGIAPEEGSDRGAITEFDEGHAMAA